MFEHGIMESLAMFVVLLVRRALTSEELISHDPPKEFLSATCLTLDNMRQQVEWIHEQPK